MFMRNKLDLFGAVVCRMIKANFCSTGVCGSVSSHPCSNHRYTVFNNNSNWTLNESLRIEKQKDINTVWLRENCRCSKCYNLETQQRNVLFHKLNSSSFEIESLKEAGEGETMEVLWGDRHISYYDKEWLRNKLASDHLNFQDKKQILWDENSVIPYIQDKKIEFKNLMNDRATLKSACENLYELGFLQIENTPKNLDATVRAAERISRIKDTFYGRSWEVNVVDSKYEGKVDVKDTAYTNVELGPHTDGNYFSEPPAILVFHHLKVADEGGEMLLVDGFKVAEECKKLDPQAYQILSSHLVNFSYKDEKRFLNETCPTLELDKATGNLKRIRFNHYDRSANLMHSPSVPVSEFYEALSLFSGIANDPKNHLEIPPKPGTIYLVDNWRVFHARKAFKGHRVFVGCYLERDEWMSNLRIL